MSEFPDPEADEPASIPWHEYAIIEEGRIARKNGLSESNNPYKDQYEAGLWLEGFRRVP